MKWAPYSGFSHPAHCDHGSPHIGQNAIWVLAARDPGQRHIQLGVDQPVNSVEPHAGDLIGCEENALDVVVRNAGQWVERAHVSSNCSENDSWRPSAEVEKAQDLQGPWIVDCSKNTLFTNSRQPQRTAVEPAAVVPAGRAAAGGFLRADARL
jgi:hypothetical protein